MTKKKTTTKKVKQPETFRKNEIPFWDRIISKVAEPEEAQDVATKNYVDTHGGSGSTYTAGENITIENNVISATDTTYSAGDNISISDENVISATDTTYSNFTGTDGTSAGVAGLVPAPATTDAGKYLKADGTWESIVIPQSGIPTTATFWGASYDTVNNKVGGNIQLGTASVRYELKTSNSGPFAAFDVSNSVLRIGPNYTQINTGLYSLSIKTSGAELNNSLDMKTHSISNVTDPTNAQDAATKNYTDNLVINYSTINGSAAPTTSTAAQYVGQLYYDTTNDDLYYCSAITAQGTTPETYTYTWNTIGGGPTVVQTIGASTADVMSQAAVTGMVYQGNSSLPYRNVVIGDEASVATQTNGSGVVIGYKAKNTYAASSNGVVIGPQAETSHRDTVTIGYRANCSQQNSVSLGANSVASRNYEVSIGSGAASNGTRFIANVTDPTLAQDAATKNYVDSFYPVGTVYTSTSATAPTIAGGTWTEIGTQTIGSSTVHYYERTA